MSKPVVADSGEEIEVESTRKGSESVVVSDIEVLSEKRKIPNQSNKYTFA